jgi:predicted HNH restriction endonuclease
MDKMINRHAKARKKPITPRSKVKKALHRLWLRSRERNEAMRVYDKRCQMCGVRASMAKGKEQKIQVHHKEGIDNWEKVIDMVYDKLLIKPEQLECLCPKCHREKHKPQKD